MFSSKYVNVKQFRFEIYQELTREFGEPAYDRVEAPATKDQKELLAKLSPQQIKLTEFAGEKIQTVLARAPSNNDPIGGVKVVAKSGWRKFHETN